MRLIYRVSDEAVPWSWGLIVLPGSSSCCTDRLQSSHSCDIANAKARGTFGGFIVSYVPCTYTNEITVPPDQCVRLVISVARDSDILAFLKRFLSCCEFYFLAADAAVVLRIIKHFFTKSTIVSHDTALLKLIQRALSAGCLLLLFNSMIPERSMVLLDRFARKE